MKDNNGNLSKNLIHMCTKQFIDLECIVDVLCSSFLVSYKSENSSTHTHAHIQTSTSRNWTSKEKEQQRLKIMRKVSSKAVATQSACVRGSGENAFVPHFTMRKLLRSIRISFRSLCTCSRICCAGDRQSEERKIYKLLNFQ